jgi:hypothetical protein
MAARSTFERETHRRIQRVLEALDADALARFSCWFGGGTRIAMGLGEYRESRDIDFLCSDASGYADLRVAVGQDGYKTLFVAEHSVELPREIRADQYGVRFPAVVDGQSIRVELVREARIELTHPARPSWTDIACLSIGDCYAEELLANCDRWADTDSLSRDLIDLAALRRAHGPIPDKAWHAAESAYKTAPRDALRRAALAFLGDAKRGERCTAGLVIDEAKAERIRATIQTLLGEI